MTSRLQEDSGTHRMVSHGSMVSTRNFRKGPGIPYTPCMKSSEKLDTCKVSPVLHQVICDSKTTLYTAHPINDSHHAHHVSFFMASKFIHGDQVCSM